MENRSTISIKVSGVPCVFPEGTDKAYLIKAGIFKINRFEVRAGFDYSRGKFLLTKSDLEKIGSEGITVEYRSSIQNPPDGEGNPSAVPFDVTRVQFNDLIVIDTSMIMTPMSHAESLFLVTIVDKRYYANRDFIGVKHSFFPTTNEVDQHADASESWREIIDSYWHETQLGSTVDQSGANYPEGLIKDVDYLRPTSALKTITDVLQMIGHQLFITPQSASQNYRVLPLSRVLQQNTAVLNDPDTKGRLIQRKSNVFIEKTFVPRKHIVMFRTKSLTDDPVKFTVDNPNGSGEGFNRVTNLFNRDSGDSSEMEMFANEVSERVFAGYETANSIDSVYFGIIQVDHSPRCYQIEYFYDVRSESVKTIIKSHKTTSSPKPPIKFKQPQKLIGVTNSDVSFGESVEVTIYATSGSSNEPSPVMVSNPDFISGGSSSATPQTVPWTVTAWFDWSEEDNPPDIEKDSRVFIFFCCEDNRWRIIRFRGGSNITKGVSVDDLTSGSVGVFSVTIDGESRLVNAQAIGDIAEDARVVIFETPDGSLCAFQPGGSVFCGDLGLAPGSYRATVSQESSVGGAYDVALLDVESENDSGSPENLTVNNVVGWAGGNYAIDSEVVLHVDNQCNHWITNSLPRECDNALVDGVSYPGRLSPSTDSSSNADMVEVYLEDDALTQLQRDSLGTNNIVNAKWWADVCPRREQRVMVHVINCELYATASLVLRDIPESMDSSSGVSILGVEDGCVVTVPTDEGCAE